MNTNKNTPAVVVLGTYPPYEDGISTFTNNLVQSAKLLFEPGIEFKVAAVDVTNIKPKDYPKEVEWIIKKNNKTDYKKVADEINKNKNIKCAIIQHEYGIFGGVIGEWSGEYILDFMQALKIPAIVVFHTALRVPPPEIKKITEEIVARANGIVVMSEYSADVYKDLYNVPPEKLKIIPHGIHPTIFEYPEQVKKREGLDDKLIMTTFGFLSPGKGIEYVIESLPAVVKEHPNAEYWLIGRTHPLVQAKSGETYRKSLEDLVKKLKLEKNVKFFNRYQSLPEILKFLSMTDIYICTSLAPEQAVSGTFSYALGSGRCVVSTKFAQAKESIVRKNMGLLVDFKSPEGFSKAILQLLDNPRMRKRMQARAYKQTRNMLWTNCAFSYVDFCFEADKTNSLRDNFLPSLNLNHLKRMTDDFGMIQFSKGTVPDKSSGYTIDDVCRALLYCVEEGVNKDQSLLGLAKVYLEFIKYCQKESGLFLNDVGESRNPVFLLDIMEIPEDANGRTLWALNALRGNANVPEGMKEEATRMIGFFEKSNFKFRFPRSKAFNLLGLTALSQGSKHPPEMLWRKISSEADHLVELFQKNATDKWQWFEPELTYANGILSAALLESFAVVNKPEYREIGLRSLEYLIEVCFGAKEVYMPIGQRGWYKKNKKRAEFDGQPEDPYSTIFALFSAYKITGEKRYLEYAKRAFSWFMGNNLLGKKLYDETTGGCHDGLTKFGPNPNEGAESTLSFLFSRLLIEKMLQQSKK